MKHIQITTPDSALYTDACQFADRVYKDTIHAGIRNPPNTLIVATEHNTIFGCIGINPTVTTSLFVNDRHYQDFVDTLPRDTRIGEQNIFAIDRFPAGIQVLLTAAISYARSIHLDKIAFAGIAVSCRTIEQLGYTVTVLGNTSPDVFSETERHKYAYWLTMHQPLSCIIDTEKTEDICHAVATRFAHKAHFAPELSIT